MKHADSVRRPTGNSISIQSPISSIIPTRDGKQEPLPKSLVFALNRNLIMSQGCRLINGEPPRQGASMALAPALSIRPAPLQIRPRRDQNVPRCATS